MKRHGELLFLFALLLPVSGALGQAADDQTANDLPQQIAAARCAYTAKDACAPATPGAHNSGNAVVAQLPRRGPGPSFGPRRPMGRPAYPGMWGQPEPSGRHALIGAVIGGLLGWAVAAKGNAGAHATLGIATVGAGLGAAIGLSVPSFPSRNPYWHRWPDDDEEAAARKSAKPGRTPGPPQQTASVDAPPSSPRPNTDHAPTPEPAVQP